MGDKEILDHFMEQLTFHAVRYAGQSKEDDWHLVEISDILFLIDEEGYIVSYAKDIYLERLKCKYTGSYVLIAGELYKNIYTDSKLKKVRISNRKVSDLLQEEIKDIILYEEAEIIELKMDYESAFMYQGQLIKSGMCYFTTPNNYDSVLTVQWKNEVLRLETVRGEVYYMDRRKKRMYSSKSWRGKKLQKTFFVDAK